MRKDSLQDSKGTIKDEDIEGIFNAVSAEWTVNFGRSENTRYGVYSKTQRAGGVAIEPSWKPVL